ncbi:hypothetical protein ABEV55_08425 [Aneurinibacillus thermoaerophilus]|uniref:hypothetical protein n=1 Tax=Aneurinibacillus thermoaerophilus TaxID=143495 RepID=UPI002E23CFD6|nr:hypothetical protein [Aneurinibacillus thermoaerophilus]
MSKRLFSSPPILFSFLLISGCTQLDSVNSMTTTQKKEGVTASKNKQSLNLTYYDDFIRLYDFDISKDNKGISISFQAFRINMEYLPVLMPNAAVVLATDKGKYKLPLANIFNSAGPTYHTLHFSSATGTPQHLEFQGLSFKNEKGESLPGVDPSSRISIYFVNNCHCL